MKPLPLPLSSRPCPPLFLSPHQQRLRGTTTRRERDSDGKIRGRRRRRLRLPYPYRCVVASYRPCSLPLPLLVDDTDSEYENAMTRARRDDDEVVALALALVVTSSILPPSTPPLPRLISLPLSVDDEDDEHNAPSRPLPLYLSATPTRRRIRIAHSHRDDATTRSPFPSSSRQKTRARHIGTGFHRVYQASNLRMQNISGSSVKVQIRSRYDQLVTPGCTNTPHIYLSQIVLSMDKGQQNQRWSFNAQPLIADGVHKIQNGQSSTYVADLKGGDPVGKIDVWLDLKGNYYDNVCTFFCGGSFSLLR